MTASPISAAKIHAKEWLFDCAAPLWSTRGVLSDGMFAEKIGQDGAPEAELNRRLRVQARQIYSFCTLGRMGWAGPWREIANAALDILLDRGIIEGRCVHAFSAKGEVVDRSLDLYDHAFALLALAHAADTLGRSDALQAAETMRIGIARWRRAEGGYWEGELTPCPPYRQNPHMHLFEAALSHHRLAADGPWEVMLKELHQLFTMQLLDASTGAITEYFDERWRMEGDAGGQIVEPGHCFEWSWLLDAAFQDEDTRKIAAGLVKFARQYGICPKRDVAINGIHLDGSVRDDAARLWPQTERLKAAVSLYRQAPCDEEAEQIARAYRGLTLYWDTPVSGSWWDRLNADGTFVEESAPASSFYHIVCALNELNQL